MNSLEDVFTTLFTAPTRAVVEAEAEYRKIWVQWLRDLQGLVEARKRAGGADALTPEQEKNLVEQQMNLAPVMTLGASIEVGVTMRLASVTKTEGNISIGVGVGAFQVSGGFGFSSQTSQESVLQARAMYALTNDSREMSLGEYLKSFSLPVTDAGSLTKAIDLLSTPKT